MNKEPRRKLVEVALPLEEINIASAREKSIRHGHPSTLHLWWARRPLAACRALLFASIIDDPDQDGVPDELLKRIDLLPIPIKYRAEWDHLSAGERRRMRLFGFIEQLVQWENSNDADTLQKAHELIDAATDGNPPPVLDPFAGGGAIPLEAQRLGLEAHASDLNPVAVLINKAMIEIPPKFAGLPPVNPDRKLLQPTWKGAQGLAEDVRYYGEWMRDQAERRIGHLYPKAKLPNGGEATVIAWIWARTVKCPNPACGVQMPLARSFALSTKKGKEAWVEADLDAATRRMRFNVKSGSGAAKEGTVSRKGVLCAACGSPQPLEYVRNEGKAGRIGSQLMAVVAEGQRKRVYLSPTREHEEAMAHAVPAWKPEGEMVLNSRHLTPVIYGYTTFASLFTSRQLTALTTFSDLVAEARDQALDGARRAGLEDDSISLEQGGQGAAAYADAVATYLALAIGRCSDAWSSLTSWRQTAEATRGTFARQALSMVWDFAETNPFSSSCGNWVGACLEWVVISVSQFISENMAFVEQRDAIEHGNEIIKYLITTDPPYYDNVPYADLSDFFYVWLRHTLAEIQSDLFGTILTPKTAELIADPFRHGGKDASSQFFEQGMRKVFTRIRETAHPDYPVTVIYAFKQSETEEEDEDGASSVASTGWETMLEGLIESGLQINGTWPMRTERPGRMRETGSNALASSIALICRPRPDSASTITRREYQSLLRSELPGALQNLQQGNIAPVDLAQASIGPGMAIYSRYQRVLDASGRPMPVRIALQMINQILDEVMAEQEGWYDEPTRWAVAWYAQNGFDEAEYGRAETLAVAKNVSIRGLEDLGILASTRGKVHLIGHDALPEDYDPAKDRHLTIWEMTQHLTRALDKHGIEAAGRLLRRFREAHPDADPERAKALAYRLYAIADGKKRSSEARPYNGLILSWGDIEAASLEPGAAPAPGGLFSEDEV